MDADTRAELRRGIEALVREAVGQSRRHGRCSVLMSRHGEPGGQMWQSVYLKLNDDTDPPPLTPAQQLALSVLLEDDAVAPQVLADFLLDDGHEYATAVAERAATEARADERRRCVDAVRQSAARVREYADSAPADPLWWDANAVVHLFESARHEMESPAP
jgi:hypothetical protein